MTDVSPWWTIIRVRGSMEAKVVECLRDNGVTAYCPMERLWAPAKEPYTKTRDKALMPGYVFADLPATVALSGMTGPGAAAIWGALVVNGHVCQVSRRAIGHLILLEHLGAFDRTLVIRARRARRFKKGELVEIVGGHLKGATGTVTQTRDKRLKVLIDYFGRAKPIEFLTTEVTPVEDKRKAYM